MEEKQTNKTNNQKHTQKTERVTESTQTKEAKTEGKRAERRPVFSPSLPLAPEGFGQASFQCHLSQERQEGRGRRKGRREVPDAFNSDSQV